MTTNKLTRLALLTGVALILFTVETQMPLPAFLPGIKLGLANVVSLYAVYRFGRKEAAMILAVRIVLGNLVCGTVAAMLYSACGGLGCLLVMCLLLRWIPKGQAWVLGALSSLGHVAGQMAAAVFVAGTAVLWTLPVLLLAALGTGLFTGYLVTGLLRREADHPIN